MSDVVQVTFPDWPEPDVEWRLYAPEGYPDNEWQVPNEAKYAHDWQDFPVAVLGLDQTLVDAIEAVGVNTVGALAEYVEATDFTSQNGGMFADRPGVDFVACVKASIIAMFANRDQWIRPDWVAEPTAIDDPAVPVVPVEVAPFATQVPADETPTALTDHEKMQLVNEAYLRARTTHQEMLDAKEYLATKKRADEAAVENLMNVIESANRPDKPMPLFDQMPMSVHVDPPKLASDTGQVAPPLTDSQISATPIEKMIDPPNVVSFLQEAGLDTVGKLVEWQKSHGPTWDKDIKVEGRRKPKNFRDIVDAAWIAFCATAN